ncbi:guanylate kinase-related [Anaeramoeba ignava]|uniref:guanylate kinase n=1 Tax=Anaeramoeba ignava TaxID=1746090 RepID=A0A9Q0LQN1_ANAIG|nr:guanylate kinase-related [Anaeramoeba ignava]|eukprot:Anaeramoba_ignava/a224400_23.p1 GENE.a224400_23~~a224400_23.p1  ORF type:complete len:194 (-),score=72.37 a224400_23:44-625(-)
MEKKKSVFVIVGASGSGKSTVLNRLMDIHPSKFGYSISHTTRKPRGEEKDGIHYHFITLEQFEKDEKDGKFLETATVHGNRYGTSFEAINHVISENKICVLDLNIDGALSVKKTDYNSLMILVKPPSFEVLEKRLRDRGTETEDLIQIRLETARKEDGLFQKHKDIFDYTLINDDLDKAVAELEKFVKDFFNF